MNTNLHLTVRENRLFAVKKSGNSVFFASKIEKGSPTSMVKQ